LLNHNSNNCFFLPHQNYVIRCCFILFCFFLFTDSGKAQEDSLCEKTKTLVEAIEKNHFKARETNDDFSSDLFHSFISRIDPNGLYFTQEDIAALNQYKFKLDDEIRNEDCSFLRQIISVHAKNLIRARGFMEEFSKKPLQLNTKDSLEIYNDTVIFCKDATSLKTRWGKWFKYFVLDELYSSDDSPEKKTANDEKQAAEKVYNSFLKKINRYSEAPEEFEKYILSQFLKSISLCYDPHTEYFSSVEKAEFDEALSTESFSFGISIVENKDGKLAIDYLVPGGPAWKSNELHKDDILLNIEWSPAESFDVDGYDADEFFDLVDAHPAESVKLTVRKTTGKEISVTLYKEKIRADENAIKSFILNGEKKIGYISLPGFYSEFENDGVAGCANDLAREIVKLQQVKVDGIILDLRFNGGGSLSESLDLAGIFIDEGPLCILRSKNQSLMTIKDQNRGTIYNGPLAVIINGASASASEVLSGVLQDYNRAVIIGGATYGKATAQMVIPLDSAELIAQALVDPENVSVDFLKVTTRKIYRINGSSHQMTGVLPDVPLSDLFQHYNIRESESEFALEKDSVIKKVYAKPALPLPVNELREKSRFRLQENQNYIAIQKYSDSVSAYYKPVLTVPLNAVAFRDYRNQLGRLFDILEENEQVNSPSFSLTYNEYDKSIMIIDQHLQKIYDAVTENIRHDFYIDETYRVLTDLINFGK